MKNVEYVIDIIKFGLYSDVYMYCCLICMLIFVWKMISNFVKM